MRILVLAAAAALLCAPVKAKQFLVVTGGELLQSPAPNQTLEGLPFGTGSRFVASWVIDMGGATAVDQTPPGSPTTGRARLFPGAVSQGYLGIDSPGGIIGFRQGSASFGAIYGLDNVAAGGDRRLDQLTITDGTRATDAGLVFGMPNSIGAFLPSGVFLGSISFGRSTSGTADNLPTLLTSLDAPDPFTLWATGPYTFGVNFRSGTATTQAEYLALPVRSFSARNVTASFFEISAVPEPRSWMMLMLGFGTVGMAMRRRPAPNCG